MYGISVSGSRVACGVEDGTLRILDIVTPDTLPTADQTPLAAASQSGGVSKVSAALRERCRMAGGIGILDIPVWSRDGRLVAVGSGSGRIKVWESDSGTSRGDFAGPPVVSKLFLPDSGDLLSCDQDGHQRVWPIRSGSPAAVLTAHRSFVYPVVTSEDGRMLLTGGWDGESGYSGGLKLWNAQTAALVAEYGRPGDVFWSADLTPDGRYAVAGIRNDAQSRNRIEVIDLHSVTVLTTFKPPGELYAVGRVIALHDGNRVVSTHHMSGAYVWELRTGKVLWHTDMNPRPNPLVYGSVGAAASSDGHLLALTNGEVDIRLVNADTYADIRRWDAHTDVIWSLAFSPDSKWLLSASDDKTIGVWDVRTGALVARLAGHNANVLCVAMSPGGTRIASGGRDGYLRLWDTTDFENVAQLGGHKGYIYSLAWSPDGRQLFSGSGDSTVRIWDTRNLTEQVAAVRERLEALPHVEAKIAGARASTHDAVTAVEAVIDSQQPSERELARQVAARFVMRGMPAYYRAPRAASPIVIDGRIDDAWNAAPWSEPFVDIEGNARPKPRFETQMRMMWDDKYLYVVARLEEPHVCATLSTRDDVVFRDNDFEVFIDPDGQCRWYDEIEVNALGTIFDLRLDQPYSEGGRAHTEWSPPDLRAAVAIDGTLNDPSDVDRGWTVEIAIPFAAIKEHASAAMPPRPGDVWRINFSRIEWQHDVVDGHYVKRPGTKDDNWVWTPQHVVNMHVPREWGFVEFTDDRK